MTSKRKTAKPKPKRRRKPARRPAGPTSDQIVEALHQIARGDVKPPAPNPPAFSSLDAVLYGNRLEKALADVDRACEALKART